MTPNKARKRRAAHLPGAGGVLVPVNGAVGTAAGEGAADGAVRAADAAPVQPGDHRHEAASPPAAPLLPVSDAVRFFQEASVAASTRRGWQAGWVGFTAWCDAAGVLALPAGPGAVSGYLAWMARLLDDQGRPYYAAGTISRHLLAIDHAHTAARLPAPGEDPGVRAVLHGIRRTRATVPVKRRTPLMLRDLRKLLTQIDAVSFPAGVIGRRDRAILLAGFAGAWRRSELAALTVSDLTCVEGEGWRARVRRSKTDQDGQGQTKALPYGKHPDTCVPCALACWLRLVHAQQDGGRAGVIAELAATDPNEHLPHDDTALQLLPPELPVFRPVRRNGTIGPRGVGGGVVSDVVARRAAAAGLAGDWGGHSLRAGFITQALQEHATFHEVMRQTGQHDPATVELYARENAPLDGNAITRIRL